MENAFNYYSLINPFEPLSYWSKYFFNSPHKASINANYSSLTPGILDSVFYFFGDSSTIWSPLPKYCLIKLMYYWKLMKPSLLVSKMINISLRSYFGGFTLIKKHAYVTNIMNSSKLINLVFQTYEFWSLYLLLKRI